MINPEMKFAYLEKRFEISLKPGLHPVKMFCELCNKTVSGEIYCTANFKPSKVLTDGHFHHKDGDRNHDELTNMIFLCKRCHKKLHKLGEVLRWLKEIHKTISDFPEAIKLKSIRYF